MLQSQLFSRTSKKNEFTADAKSHELFVRGGYIDQLASGIWSLLPLGFRSMRKVENIIRQEMDAIGSQEILMPSMQPKKLWVETDRWDTFQPPLFTFKDRHGKDYLIAPTHEEVVTDLARKFIFSYKQLPIAVYQIQTKFRNEIRCNGGLLRVREFCMKDLYSFHAEFQDLDVFYKKVIQAYFQIYKRCGLETVMVEASSGSIGGSVSNEFMALSKVGEDKVLLCDHCHTALNQEVLGEARVCPKCNSELIQKQGIEVGHVFQLGEVYSKKMNALYTDRTGSSKPLIMGCYGIGVGRLLATIVETHYDDNGIIWPKEITPFHVHVVLLGKNREVAEAFYRGCQKRGIEALFDDREDAAAIKLKDTDLLGISLRIVISDKTGDAIEFKERSGKEVALMDFDQAYSRILKYYNK